MGENEKATIKRGAGEVLLGRPSPASLEDTGVLVHQLGEEALGEVDASVRASRAIRK